MLLSFSAQGSVRTTDECLLMSVWQADRIVRASVCDDGS